VQHPSRIRRDLIPEQDRSALLQSYQQVLRNRQQLPEQLLFAQIHQELIPLRRFRMRQAIPGPFLQDQQLPPAREPPASRLILEPLPEQYP
jgi:hypothetical protein